LIDVIVTSTCRKHFLKTYKSFIMNIEYDGSLRFIVNVDVHDKNKKWLPKLLKIFKEKQINDVHINDEKPSHAGAINYLFNKIETEFYFHLEDDWIFLNKIKLDPILKIMKKYEWVHSIRFNKEKIIKVNPSIIREYSKRKELYLLPGEEVKLDSIDLVKTSIWSLNPHIGRSSTAKKFLNIPEGINPEDFITKKYPQVIGTDGLFIYGNIGEGHIVQDIGRPNILIKKIKTLCNILRDPSLIKKENRIKREVAYRGKKYEN
jgi:hypothetical protein